MVGDMTIKEQTRQVGTLLADVKSLLEKNNELLKEQNALLREFYWEFHSHFKENEK